MKNILLSLFVLIIWVLGTNVAESKTPESDKKFENVEIGKTYSISSKVLGTERRLTVRLPGRYANESNATFPVLYLMDGGPEQDFSHIAGILQSTDINWTIEPMILVGVETIDRAAEITPPTDNPKYDEGFPKRGGADEFRKFLELDVMPWVEENYRVDDRKILMGESLAGLFVLETYLKSPKLFTHYGAISPSLWWDELSLANSAMASLNESKKNSPFLYLTLGSEGGEMQRGVDKVLQALRQTGTSNWVYVDRRDSEDHGTIYHPGALDMLRTYFSTPYRAGAGSDMFWMFKDGIVPPLSKKAKENVEIECTKETAEKITFKTYNSNPNLWRGVCVLIKPGMGPTEKG